MTTAVRFDGGVIACGRPRPHPRRNARLAAKRQDRAAPFCAAASAVGNAGRGHRFQAADVAAAADRALVIGK
jgi:hypothetical protein